MFPKLAQRAWVNRTATLSSTILPRSRSYLVLLLLLLPVVITYPCNVFMYTATMTAIEMQRQSLAGGCRST